MSTKITAYGVGSQITFVNGQFQGITNGQSGNSGGGNKSGNTVTLADLEQTFGSFISTNQDDIFGDSNVTGGQLLVDSDVPGEENQNELTIDVDVPELEIPSTLLVNLDVSSYEIPGDIFSNIAINVDVPSYEVTTAPLNVNVDVPSYEIPSALNINVDVPHAEIP